MALAETGLPLFVRLAGRPVILLGTGAAADAKRRLLDRAGAVVAGESAPAALAIVAIEDEEEALAAVARLKARGILVNAVDRPALCDFTLPAFIDRAPVVVAIGTGGASAGLAAALRQRLEALLPAGLGTLATALGEARGALRRVFPQGDTRRRALGLALGAGGALDPLVDHPPGAVDQWLADPALPRARLEQLFVPADPDLLTLRDARLLGAADRLYLAEAIPPMILARARADADRIDGVAPPSVPAGLSLELYRA
ncbi:NAD(P)-dependent oxidoreductase [Sphingomonas sp.]|uniref:siroheme synthase n=1 Tax=Sphingomonas sp. TaxID=28214 RepID=UPI001D607B26|nr:NAD(P)-dependent oxidoreductase [Sphingomonas sp.]MBX9795340.1 siroheme synthase [Sphingomonas sp.]